MSSRPRVLVTDYTWADTGRERAILKEIGAELIEAPAVDEASLVAYARDVDAILTCFGQVTANVIASAGPRLKVIARYGVGVDNIDVVEATNRGVPVTNVPDYCVDEVAEHVIAGIFALERGITVYDRARAEDAHLRTDLGTRRISDRTLGIIGGGRIGSATARLATSLGMRTLVHHPTGRAGAALADLLSDSDYISLHVPLTPETSEMVDADFLAAMKPTSFLLNAARGGVVDTVALADALDQGRIAGAALDVVESEDADAISRLRSHERVILTPHTAFYSLESVRALADTAARSVVDVLTGRAPHHLVNTLTPGADAHG
jgi:D-3-phosphoglycerate dehydrogenase / 2-oxoglutarate reductase